MICLQFGERLNISEIPTRFGYSNKLMQTGPYTPIRMIDVQVINFKHTIKKTHSDK